MQFLRENQQQATQAIVTQICNELFAGKRVLWLVSGGSNIAIEVTVMDKLRDHCGERLGGLAILPMDERYGEAGHKDSNTQQLREAGFDPGIATWIDVLVQDKPLDETVAFYNEIATTALTNAGAIVGQFGLGPDGHVAGILPDSPVTEDTDELVVGYKWSDYTRMTLTPKALKMISVAFVPAFGDNKQEASERLHKYTEPFSKLPALLLNEIPEVYIYNDFIESEG